MACGFINRRRTLHPRMKSSTKLKDPGSGGNISVIEEMSVQQCKFYCLSFWV
jgi:hypothetical protein